MSIFSHRNGCELVSACVLCSDHAAVSDPQLKAFLLDVVDNILTEVYLFSNNVTLFLNFNHLVTNSVYFLT